MENPNSEKLNKPEIVFHQRRFFATSQYHVVEDGVSVSEKWLTGAKKYKVSFENIAKEPIEVTTSTKYWLWLAIVFTILTVLTGLMQLFGQDIENGTPFIWGTFAVSTGLSFFISREHFLVFRRRMDIMPLVLHKNKPSPYKLSEFLSSLQKTKNEYLRKNYLRDDDTPVADTLHKLSWLRELGSITDEEFDKLKKSTIEKEQWSGTPPSPN